MLECLLSCWVPKSTVPLRWTSDMKPFRSLPGTARISGQYRPALAVAALGLVLAGCDSDAAYNSAIMRLDSEWKTANDRTLRTMGRRIVAISRSQALLAARGAGQKLGMLVEKEECRDRIPSRYRRRADPADGRRMGRGAGRRYLQDAVAEEITFTRDMMPSSSSRWMTPR